MNRFDAIVIGAGQAGPSLEAAHSRRHDRSRDRTQARRGHVHRNTWEERFKGLETYLQQVKTKEKRHGRQQRKK
jgi:hypothetical protein